MARLRSAICMGLAFLMLFSVGLHPAAAKSGKGPDAVITAHEPKTRMSAVKKAPAVKKTNKTWLWVLLGAIVVGAGAAAVAGSGDNGSSGGSQADEGSISASW